MKCDTLVTDCQPILPGRASPLISVQKCLGANLGNGVVNETRRVVISKECIKGFDVRIDSFLQGGIRCPVGRRVSEEVFAAECVVLVIPRLAGRSHD